MMYSKCRCHVHTFVILFLMDLFDFVSDWLFYVDVKLAKEGLVYGPVEPAVVKSILAFSIIGTITFIVELVNLYRETFKDSVYVDSDLLSAIVVWIEDVPQIILSLHIALCREEPISIFQLTKAAVILLTAIVRIVVFIVKYCNKEAIRSHYHVPYKVLIMLGVILETGCAIAIFVLTQTERNEAGDINFRVPHSLVRDEFNDQRYFAGVAIFVNHRGVFDKGRLDQNPNDLTANWIRLAPLDDIREKGLVNYRYDYQDEAGQLRLAIWQRENSRNSPWTLSECYTIDYDINNTDEIFQQNASTCTSAGFMYKPTSVFLTFKFTPPEEIFKRRVFGDIAFNAKIIEGNSCQNLKSVADNIDDGLREKTTLTLHFYRTGSNISFNEARHLNQNIKKRTAFYKNDGKTLLDVKDVWKTGWRECSMTGYVGPPLDRSVPVAC